MRVADSGWQIADSGKFSFGTSGLVAFPRVSNETVHLPLDEVQGEAPSSRGCFESKRDLGFVGALVGLPRDPASI